MISAELKVLEEDSDFTFQFLDRGPERSIVLDISPCCESLGWVISAFKYPYKVYCY